MGVHDGGCLGTARWTMTVLQLARLRDSEAGLVMCALGLDRGVNLGKQGYHTAYISGKRWGKGIEDLLPTCPFLFPWSPWLERFWQNHGHGTGVPRFHACTVAGAIPDNGRNLHLPLDLACQDVL